MLKIAMTPIYDDVDEEDEGNTSDSKEFDHSND